MKSLAYRSVGIALLTLAGTLAGCSVSTTGNGITIQSKTRFVNPTVNQASTTAWAGGTIDVENDGVNPSVNGGVTIVGDASVTAVTAVARPVAYANANDEASADQSIADVIATFAITQNGNTTTVHCGHGGDHGSSSAAQAGCEYLEVHVPIGTTAQALGLIVGSGNGDLNVSGPIVGSIQANCKGSGDAAIAITPTQGANITVNGGDAVTVSLPSGFAADMITLSGQQIDTTAFPDVKSGQGRGQAGTGAAGITVSSSGILDSDIVKLASQ